MSNGVSARRIADTPVAVIDFETTGLTAGYDRVVEASVVRIDPGAPARVVFDTLVNPSRPVAASEIHGITDADVAKAPRFQDVAGELLAAINGCVLAAYNVYFDIKFLSFELANAGVDHQPPYFCLMYMRPLLGLGSRCKLDVACQSHGIDYETAHVAAKDAMACAGLFAAYRTEMDRRGVSTFAELAAIKRYKFSDSFACSPFPEPSAFGLRRLDGLVSRAGFEVPVDPDRKAMGAYWDALRTVLTDLQITDEELSYVKAEQKRSGLKPEQLRVLHARAFVNVLSQFASDQWLDDREVVRLRRLHDCLRQLGWAPGQ